MVSFLVGVGALQMMLDRGKELDWFSSDEIRVLAVVAVVGIALLIVREVMHHWGLNTLQASGN